MLIPSITSQIQFRNVFSVVSRRWARKISVPYVFNIISAQRRCFGNAFFVHYFKFCHVFPSVGANVRTDTICSFEKMYCGVAIAFLGINGTCYFGSKWHKSSRRPYHFFAFFCGLCIVLFCLTEGWLLRFAKSSMKEFQNVKKE